MSDTSLTPELEDVIQRHRQRHSQAQELLRNGSPYKCPIECDGFCYVEMPDGKEWTLECPDKGTKDCNYTRKKLREHHALLEEIGISRRYWNPQVELIRPREAVESYCNEIRMKTWQGRGMLILGPVGVGKTMILSYVAQAAIKENIMPRYWYMPDLSESLKNWQNRENAVRRCKNASLLLLDDFGVETHTDSFYAVMDEIFENRNANEKSTFVTSNVHIDELKADLNLSRIIDRWRASMSLVEISGESMRGD